MKMSVATRILVLASCLILSNSLLAHAWEITVDGEKISAGEKAWTQEDGTLMVSIDSLVPALLDDYVFNFEGWQITALGNDFAVTAWPNSTEYLRDGFKTSLKASPVIKEQILWVPIEGFAKILNYTGKVDNEKQSLALQSLPSAANAEVKEDIRLRRMSSVFNNIKYPRPDIAYFEDILIPTDYGYIPARFYNPAPEKNEMTPLYINIHGGAYNLGSIASSDHVCRDIANKAGAKVLSIDYRMLPDYPFPAGWDDVYSALEWAYNNGDKLGIDKNRIVIGGDSAGASLGATAAKMARDNKLPLAGQMLAYPVTNLESDTWKHIFAKPEDGKLPYATPLNGDLKGLAPTLLLVAEEDNLRPEGELYAQKLKDAGVMVDFEVVLGTKHGFLGNNEGGRQRVADYIKNIKPIK